MKRRVLQAEYMDRDGAGLMHNYKEQTELLAPSRSNDYKKTLFKAFIAHSVIGCYPLRNTSEKINCAK